MSIGYAVNKVDVDNQMGRLIVEVREALDACADFKTWLDDAALGTDAFLTTLGYSAGEITTIRAAFSAMNNLRRIAHAEINQASQNDFFFDAKKLTGINQ